MHTSLYGCPLSQERVSPVTWMSTCRSFSLEKWELNEFHLDYNLSLILNPTKYWKSEVREDKERKGTSSPQAGTRTLNSRF